MIPRAQTVKRPGDLILARDCTMIVTDDGRQVRLHSQARQPTERKVFT